MTMTLKTEVAFEPITCGVCGVQFALTEVHVRYLQDHGATFYCPNGHPRAYVEPAVTRLEKELRAKQTELDRQKIRLSQAEADARWEHSRAEETKRRLSATRGVVTRIKNRVGNGVCPCCNRTFQQLGRHMKAKHPEWEPLNEERAEE
jgi:hypothetical protein